MELIGDVSQGFCRCGEHQADGGDEQQEHTSGAYFTCEEHRTSYVS